ncbi:MAG: hypothetical protein J6X18_12050 [Bacteroidales bacterium]|nr:hypothetical protein [Bacteroidales bacterium]
MKPHFITFIVLSCIVTSCAQTRYIAQDANIPEINDILLFEPYTEIGLISHGDDIELIDSLAETAKNKLTSFLCINSNITRVTEYANDTLANQYLLNFFKQVERTPKNTLNTLQIPTVYDSILTANNKRYGMLVCAYGFSRTKQNRISQNAKAIGIGVATAILTLGMGYVAIYPENSKSHIDIVIIDAENDNVIFQNISDRESEPLEDVKVCDQLADIFRGFAPNEQTLFLPRKIETFQE